MTMKQTQIGFQLPDEDAVAAHEIAKFHGISLSDWIRQCLDLGRAFTEDGASHELFVAFKDRLEKSRLVPQAIPEKIEEWYRARCTAEGRRSRFTSDDLAELFGLPPGMPSTVITIGRVLHDLGFHRSRTTVQNKFTTTYQMLPGDERLVGLGLDETHIPGTSKPAPKKGGLRDSLGKLTELTNAAAK